MPKLTDVKLTDANKRKWIETRSALLWKCPAFTHLLFSMLNPTKGELAALFTTEVPIAATDGSNLILNPDTFFGFTLDERVFIVAHEILHCVYNHCVLSLPMRKSQKVKYADGTSLPYDAKLMNVAMDLVINDTLINDKIGKFPTCGIHDPKIATAKDGFLDAYKKVWKDNEKNGGKGSGSGSGSGTPGSGTGAGGFDQIMDPGAGQGQDAQSAAQGRSQTEWDTAVAAAVASAKMQGKLPANLERLLSEIVDPTVPWQDHIRAFFSRKVGSGNYDWAKPDRRLIQRDIYAPRRSGSGCGPVVVGIDTSGSVGQRELDVFFGELRGILDDVRPTEVHVVWCDAKVHKVDCAEDSADVDTLKPHGGGGTDFRPVFDWIDGSGVTPEALVYMTDGYGPFPDQAPNYPVVWGAIVKGVKYPFGDVVDIEIK